MRNLSYWVPIYRPLIALVLSIMPRQKEKLLTMNSARAEKHGSVKTFELFPLAKLGFNLVALFYVILTMVFFVLYSRVSYGSSWYETETRTCDFESPAAGIPSVFTRSKNKAGGQYLSVPKSDINTIIAAPTQYVRNNHVLTAAEIDVLRANLQLLKTSPQVGSVALGIAGKISNLTGALKLASGQLLNWLKNNSDAEVKNLDRFYDFITVGGQYSSLIAFEPPQQNGAKPLMLEMRTYGIQVGDEASPRRWLFSACLLPVEVILMKMETKAVTNNKRLDKQADGTWRMWDYTDQKYSPTIFTYVEQDQEYAYFRVSPDKEYRVHMYGGPMQSKSSGAQDWSTLYTATESE